jgi:hypothetical protein
LTDYIGRHFFYSEFSILDEWHECKFIFGIHGLQLHFLV